MVETLTYLFIIIGSALFIRYRTLRYLRYFQQEEYSPIRFLKWVWEHRAFDTKGSAIAIAAASICYLTTFGSLISFLASAALCAIVFFEEDPTKQGKLRLNMTERAKRIFQIALAVYILFSLTAAFFSTTSTFFWLCQLALFQITPLYLLISNAILQPGEQKRQRGYVDEAKRILSNVSPYVIGITGSYGKTSTKDALSQILQITLAPTFWPAKGINTPMGITREIRNNLQEGHQYAVIEMGAYGRGSIARLCALTPPHAAIITIIGSAHLERFGSYDNILLAKSELAQAVPYDGILVCNGDNDGTRAIAQKHPKKTTLLYGFDTKKGPLDCTISSWSITPKGTSFALSWKGKSYEGFTPLFGKQALSNAIGAFTMACALGSNPEYVLAVIRQLQPVDNRLQVKKDGDITFLNDAYNSNPTGFAAALDVLKALPGKRRIVMTPGIIELGLKQYEENERIGHLAAQICDMALVVGETNKKALMEGLINGGLHHDNVIVCETREKAFQELKAKQQPGDIILIENDLTDLYEKPAKF